MKRVSFLLSLSLLPALSLVPTTQVFAQNTQNTPAPLTLDQLFPEKPLTGKSARNVKWSPDDRYVAYLWNAYDDKGFDLWIYDTKDNKAKRVTTIDSFFAFDRELPAIKERYEKDKVENERRKKLDEKERKKLEDEDKQKERDRKEPLKEYSGVGEIEWAHKSNDLLLTYKNDIYRCDMNGKLTRLTKTRDNENDIRWTKDDTGFTFRRADGVYRARFDSPVLVQLNPELPTGLTTQGYVISPDETKLLITTSKSIGGPERQVSYITYRERFAKAMVTNRSVGDDPWNNESYLFAYDLNDLNDDPAIKENAKPWEAFKLPAGEAPDSKTFVFATWKRDKKELQVVVGDFAKKTAKPIYKDTSDGEHRSPSLCSPFFTPDGKQVVALLEKGFRHAFLINPLTESATQLTRGDFEVYPLRFSPDGKSLLVRSDKEDTSRMDLYKVKLDTGEMTRLTQKTGTYAVPEIAHKSEKWAASFRAWDTLPEMTIDDKPITDSHAPEAKERITRLVPTRFSFVNRGGQKVEGDIYVPANLDKSIKRPLLIYVYGGPLGTDKQVTNGQADRFGIYCAETLGYLYATIDPRGSSGYGSVFGKANYEKPGTAQVEDLTDGVKYLQSVYNIDADKVGIHGWSFGGFQTQMCLYTAPDVFKLGIAGAGPTEWQNYNTWYVGGVIGANKKADELDKFSLTKIAKNLQSPLLLLHGLEDTNVLAQDTIHVYRELLKAEKGPLVELILDPTGGHGLGGDIKTKDRYAIYAGFLTRRWGIVK
jgi:dipeptidyl-peptidase 4